MELNIVFDIHDVLIDFDYRYSFKDVCDPEALTAAQSKTMVLEARKRIRTLLKKHCPVCGGECTFAGADKIAHIMHQLILGHDAQKCVKEFENKLKTTPGYDVYLNDFAIVSKMWIDVEHILLVSRPIVQSFVLLNYLRKTKSYGIYILSNASNVWFDQLFKHNFESQIGTFDGVLLSGEAKVLKPNPQIFSMFLEKFALNPQECLMLDDKVSNIQAAKDFGMRGVVFDANNFENILHQLCELNALEPKDVANVLNLVESKKR